MRNADLMSGLPGEALVREGLADLEAGRRTIATCLVAIARPRLAEAGLVPGAAMSGSGEPERNLYALLRQEGGDAYSRYNALLRELASFEAALDRRLRTSRG